MTRAESMLRHRNRSESVVEDYSMPGYIRMFMGGLTGALVGFGIYKFVGCKSGACPLSGNPWTATILWALLGAMVAAGW